MVVPGGTPQKRKKDRPGNTLEYAMCVRLKRSHCEKSPFGTGERKKNECRVIYKLLFAQAAPVHNTPTALLHHVLDLFEAQAVGGLGVFVEDHAEINWLRIIHANFDFKKYHTTYGSNS
eukprot:jgi/Psemu1/27538/gm1.27538_g